MPPPGAPVPAAARQRAEFTREVVEAATAAPTRVESLSAVACIGRVGRRRCPSRVYVALTAEGVEWSCETCGDAGVVTGFAGTESDLSRYTPIGETVFWVVSDEERAVLIAATDGLPALRAIVARARPIAEIPEALLLRATVEELDEVYTLVEELTDATRSRSRLELLDGLRASLCSSMDSAIEPEASE